MTPSVSVIIPVYERNESGVAAVRSAIMQTNVELEVVIVDDGSPNPFVLPSDLGADPRIRLFRQANGGAAAARNRGVSEASGEWIAFLDSDDIWLQGKLRGQLDHAQSLVARGRALLTVVVCGFSQIEIATGEKRVRVPLESWSPEELAAGCWFAPGSTALIPRAAFEKVGLLDERLRRLEDLDWFLRLALAGGGVATWPKLAVEVNVGQRPSVAVLDDAVRTMKAKWLGDRLKNPLCRRNLSAYLALEQANARWHAKRWLSFANFMTMSWALKPRISIPLRNWWSSSLPSARP